MSQTPTDKPSLTVVLPTMREAGNLEWLFNALHEQLDDQVDQLEILVVDRPTDDGTQQLCREHDVRYEGHDLGFADALKFGFDHASHELIVTMDADGSHDPFYIRWMLHAIHDCDLVICSRYVARGGQDTSWFRYVTSRMLNIWMSTACSLPLQDLSGGFKLYRKEVFRHIDLESAGFEIQCEIAIKAFGHGFRLREIPFCYHPRMEGRSKAAIVRYGLAFLRGSLRLRRYRNSRAFCDYDERAYRSRWPWQRLWQRRRYSMILKLLQPDGKCLDIGCGSGRLVLGFSNVTGLDNNPSITRYLRHEPRHVVDGDAAALPFDDGAFDQVYACEVFEHLPADTPAWDEAARVLKPGGRMLVTTPDYGGIRWPLFKALWRLFLASPTGHDHATKYTRKDVEQHIADAGLSVVEQRRMFGAILMYLCEKPAATSP